MCVFFNSSLNSLIYGNYLTVIRRFSCVTGKLAFFSQTRDSRTSRITKARNDPLSLSPLVSLRVTVNVAFRIFFRSISITRATPFVCQYLLFGTNNPFRAELFRVSAFFFPYSALRDRDREYTLGDPCHHELSYYYY